MDRKFVMTGLGYGILERVYLSFFEMLRAKIKPVAA